MSNTTEPHTNPETAVQQITLLGATGSIGDNTLDVISQHLDHYRIFALTAHRNVEKMFTLCRHWRPQIAVMADESAAQQLSDLVQEAGLLIEVLSGEAGLIAVSAHNDVNTVVTGIVGAAGLAPTLAAAESGKRILLANKEPLVMAGKLVMQAVEKNNATLLPVDSEHNALFQCMPAGYKTGQPPEGVRKIILTASGGPFLNTPVDQLKAITPDQACAHPNWVMGRKISVDSATMMNKGLEVIEAAWLFNLPPEKIEVVIHPQSIIHSMVDTIDGSVLAQLGNPDMRTPIANALAWPKRIETSVAPLDVLTMGDLTFQPPDPTRFPCLQLAYDAIKTGGTAPTILNAANEVAVAAFLAGNIKFTDIYKVIATTLETTEIQHDTKSLIDLLQIDQQARQVAEKQISTQASIT